MVGTLPNATEYALRHGRSRPKGHHFAWKQAHDGWRYTPDCDRLCRWMQNRKRCPNPAVVALDRGTGGRTLWWHYCEEHMYGRVLFDGKVWDVVLVADDTAADAKGAGQK